MTHSINTQARRGHTELAERMKITSNTKICMIIGDPVSQSLSPQMHNAAYENIGLEFIYVGAQVKEQNLKNAILGIRSLGIRGITVTHPHKEKVMEFLDDIDETAKKIGAVNTIVNNNGKLTGSNTDFIGVYKALEEKTSLKGKSVAIIGAGGAARAAIFAVLSKGTKVKIFNRTIDKAKKLAEEFNCEYALLEDSKDMRAMDIIINVTTVSMDKNKSPLDKVHLRKNHIVFDAVYNPYETKLLKDAKEIGATIIHGTEWLLFQGVTQFELYTNKKAPIDVMRKAIIQDLDSQSS